MFIFKISDIFFEYTQNPPKKYIETTLGNEGVFKKIWINNVPLKVIIHGWNIDSDESNSWIFSVKTGNFYNIIMNKFIILINEYVSDLHSYKKHIALLFNYKLQTNVQSGFHLSTH